MNGKRHLRLAGPGTDAAGVGTVMKHLGNRRSRSDSDFWRPLPLNGRPVEHPPFLTHSHRLRVLDWKRGRLGLELGRAGCVQAVRQLNSPCDTMGDVEAICDDPQGM